MEEKTLLNSNINVHDLSVKQLIRKKNISVSKSHKQIIHQNEKQSAIEDWGDDQLKTEKIEVTKVGLKHKITKA